MRWVDSYQILQLKTEGHKIMPTDVVKGEKKNICKRRPLMRLERGKGIRRCFYRCYKERNRRVIRPW